MGTSKGRGSGRNTTKSVQSVCHDLPRPLVLFQPTKSPGGATTGHRAKSLRNGPIPPGKTGRALLNEIRGLEGG